MEKQQGIKLFLVLFICTVFIFSFSHFGSLTYHAMTSESDMFLKGTTIGVVDVTDKSEAEALSLLSDQLHKWQNETTIALKYKEKIVPINLEIFQFDLQGSVQTAQNGQANPVIVSIQSEDVKGTLQEISSQLSLDETELSKLNNELISLGNKLVNGKHQVSLAKILATENTIDTLISETVIELDDVSVAMTDWVTGLSPIKVPSQSQVSFLKIIEDQKLSVMPAETMSMIAAGIYRTILATNFAIIERHISQHLPNYVDLGYEAKVNRDRNLDFAFVNPNDSEYSIELNWQNPTLTVQLKGSPLLYKYNIEQTGKQEFTPKTIIQYSPQLLPSQISVQEQGKAGLLIKTLRKVYGENDEFIREDFLTEDYYAPVERIEIHGLTSTSTDTGDDTPGSNGAGNGDSTATIPPAEPVEDSDIESENDNESPNPVENTETDIWGKPNEAEK